MRGSWLWGERSIAWLTTAGIQGVGLDGLRAIKSPPGSSTIVHGVLVGWSAARMEHRGRRWRSARELAIDPDPWAVPARHEHGHAIAPDEWSGHGLITLTELRHVHQLTMTPVWDVAPHPQATDREGPGAFREHDIQPFPEGMTPPAWPKVASSVNSWIADLTALQRAVADPLTFPERLASTHAGFE